MKHIVLFSLFLAACHSDPGKELIGVVNGRSIHVRDISERLKTPLDVVFKASIEDKKAFFEQVAEQIAVEDEARRTGHSIERLFHFFDLVGTIKVSPEERAVYLKNHPEERTLGETQLTEKIKSGRKGQLEAKYKAELKRRSTVRFMADNQKQSKVQDVWDKISF
jgi:hypothetical protein